MTPQEQCETFMPRDEFKEQWDAIEATIRARVAWEREACARIADAVEDSLAAAIAERIRARRDEA